MKTKQQTPPTLCFMRTDDTSIATSDNDEPHLALDVIERLLRQKLRNNIAPYALEVDAPLLLQWSAQWDEPPFRHQNLVRELRVWSEFLARKPLVRTFFNEPFRLMDAAGLTELVYAIGENFKLLHGHYMEHGVTLSHSDLTHQNLALLKGLEFNHVCLKISQDFDLQELQVHRHMLDDFKFRHVSLELNFDSAGFDFLLHLMELLSFIKPASVHFASVASSPFQHVDREGLTSLLMQFGYFLSDSGTLLKFHSPLSKRPQDILRLGPACSSHLSNLRVTNFSTPLQYGARLDKKDLPVATCF